MSQTQECYWKTRKGETIAVGDMTEEHAKNALRMMLKWRESMRKRLLLSSLMVEVVEEAQRNRAALRQVVGDKLINQWREEEFINEAGDRS